MDNGTRDQLLGRLADAIGSVTTAHPVRVAVDGQPLARPRWPTSSPWFCAAGAATSSAPRFEGFLFPRVQRYRRGQDSPEGCYHDSFDLDALHRVLLDPLGPRGDRRFQPAVYDRETDKALAPLVTTAAADAVLLLDGVFLLRPELLDWWDLPIFVSAAFEETLARARIRDLASLGSAAGVEQRFRRRYLPSQQHYFDTVRPTDVADIVVHSDEPEHPAWEVRAAS